MNYPETEQQIIEFFKEELSKRNMKSTKLNEKNNPNSSLSVSKVFKIFNNTHRLAFVDFIQICDLLDLNPTEVMSQIFPFQEKPRLSEKDKIFLEEAIRVAKEALGN